MLEIIPHSCLGRQSSVATSLCTLVVTSLRYVSVFFLGYVWCMRVYILNIYIHIYFLLKLHSWYMYFVSHIYVFTRFSCYFLQAVFSTFTCGPLPCLSNVLCCFQLGLHFYCGFIFLLCSFSELYQLIF